VQTESPRLSANDLTLYFGRDGDVYTTTRTIVGGTWTTPVAYTAVNGTDGAPYVKWLTPCDVGAQHYFMISRDNGSAYEQDLFEGALGTTGTVDATLNSPDDELSSWFTDTCLSVYFTSDRSGADQLYMATRSAVGAAWSVPVEISCATATAGCQFGPAAANKDLWISADQHTAYLASTRDNDASLAVYMSTR
jgi:hypothetical protein